VTNWPILPELLEMLTDPDRRQGKYLARLTEGTLLLIRISEGEPTDEVLDAAEG
jgi:hypothetical protein